MTEHAAHVRLGIDGPHVHPHAELVRRPNEAWGHQAQYVAVALRYLEGLVGRSQEPAQAQALQELEHRYFRCRRSGRDPPAGDLPEAADDAQVARDDERPIRGLGLFDRLPERLLDVRLAFLYLDVDRNTRKFFVNLLQGRNGNALAPVRVGLAAIAGEPVPGV